DPAARLSADRYVGYDDAVDRNLGLTGEQRDRHLVGGCRAHRSLEDLPLVLSHALTDRHPVARHRHLNLAGVAGQDPQSAESTSTRDREAADAQPGPIPAPRGGPCRVEVGTSPA